MNSSVPQLLSLDPAIAYNWALAFKSRLSPKAEEIIATSAKYSVMYARDVIGGRFELGEPAIAFQVDYTYLYARDVIGGRFELGEFTISKHAVYSFQYAMCVICRRFELGEPQIMRSVYSKNYALQFGLTLDHVNWQKDGF